MLSQTEYRTMYDAMMRGDRQAGSEVFEHAREVGDKHTMILSYYAMAGPVTVAGTAEQQAEDLAFIREFLVGGADAPFASLEEMKPITQDLQQQGILLAWVDPSTSPPQTLADIAIRAPGGVAFRPGGAVYVTGEGPVSAEVVAASKKKKGGGGAVFVALALAAGGVWYYRKNK